MKHHMMTIAGIECALPLCPITPELYIAAFILLGNAPLSEACARELLKIAPEYDYIITAEAKGIPLAHEMARQAGNDCYIVARKSPKLYMSDLVEVDVKTITTAHEQKLYLDGGDVVCMRGKRILVVDDVISTGESLRALESLVEQVGGTCVGKMAVLAEGDAQNRDDILFLEPLPLFNANGEAL